MVGFPGHKRGAVNPPESMGLEVCLYTNMFVEGSCSDDRYMAIFVLCL